MGTSFQRILVTGAAGQVGAALIPALQKHFGSDSVLASDVRPAGIGDVPFVRLDVLDTAQIKRVMVDHATTYVVHLAALLSDDARRHPRRALEVNVVGTLNVLEAAREHGCGVYAPSSIAAFGAWATDANRPVPQVTVQRPTSMYGVTKVAGELLADFYFSEFGVDVRGLRYPGLISAGKEPPRGGTTDYAVEMFHGALREGRYTCYLQPDTMLDMMLLDDAVRATIELMTADSSRLRFRNSYNVTAVQLTPEILADSIREFLPSFDVTYAVDAARQNIANSWPRALDDTAARDDWGWMPQFDVRTLTLEMLSRLDREFARPLGV